MTLVTERYTLTSELGRGEMAIVHRARDARHGRDASGSREASLKECLRRSPCDTRLR